MDAPYPTPPSSVPPDLTAPTPAYRRHTWASVGALAGFVLLYLGLAGWFGLTAYRLFQGAWHAVDSNFLAFLLAIPPLFLFALLAKGLFFVRKGEIGDAIEVTAAEEPALFAFIHRVADEAGAPRPHRVFLTPDVNASVFHDLSFWNLVWPSRKNLNIGLGLVNIVTLDELKAVLAHEFGHFAQRTMAVGTWVYVAQQAIGAVVARRDGFDKFLDGLSRFDLRIAWIGWLMRLVVWSIRVILDTAFRGLLYLQRALSREMEFQADLVSVALCGSDSLVHALRRLGPADDAMQRAMAFASRRGASGAPIADLYSVQTRILGKLRTIWHDPTLGHIPPRPEGDAAAHRVFTRDVVEVPRMWATHPPSHEREANMKRRYVASTLDERPGWSVFADPEATRRRMTAYLYKENMPTVADKPVADDDETFRQVDSGFSRAVFDTAWRGVYVGRSVVQGVKRHEALYALVLTDRDAIGAALDGLYPPTLVETLRTWRGAEEQVTQLDALAAGVLRAPGGVIHFHGRTIRRRELAGVLAEARAERDALRATLADHDRAVRTAHRSAARALGGGWEDHLVNLARVLHYAEHLEADLADADGALNNVFRIVTADGRVSEAEAKRLIVAANVVHESLATIYGQANWLTLPAPVAARFPDASSWQDILGETLKLGPATRDGIAGNWFEAAGTWVSAARRALDLVGAAALDVLLETETRVAGAFREGTDLGEAPPVTSVPKDHPTLVPGEGRPLQARLGWWDRFQTADGWLPGAARLVAAAGVLAPAFFFTSEAGTATVHVYNGLGVPVRVALGDNAPFVVKPGDHWPKTVGTTTGLPVMATTLDGTVIESFTPDADVMWADYVYNVASADTLVDLSVGYGTESIPDPRGIGATRWLLSTADYTLTDAPRSIEAKGPTIKHRLITLRDEGIDTQFAYAGEAERAVLTMAHVRWDPLDSADYTQWALIAAHAGVPAADVLDALRARTGSETNVVVGRIAQQLGGAEVCAEHVANAAARPDDADAAYLGLRCLPDGTGGAATRAAVERFPDHPWILWSLGWVQTSEGDWAGAAATLERVAPMLPEVEGHLRETQVRVGRMLGADLAAQTALLSGGEHRVHRELLAVEAGEPPDVDVLSPYDRVAAARVRGDLPEAVRLAAAVGADGAWYAWMNAASDGATPEDIAATATLPADAGLNGDAVWVALALLTREGRDTTALVAKAGADSPDRLARIQPILDAATPAAIAAAVEAAAVAADPEERGWVRLVGLIRLGAADGADAPPGWRREATALLLPWQRPWVRPDGLEAAR